MKGNFCKFVGTSSQGELVSAASILNNQWLLSKLKLQLDTFFICRPRPQKVNGTSLLPGCPCTPVNAGSTPVLRRFCASPSSSDPIGSARPTNRAGPWPPLRANGMPAATHAVFQLGQADREAQRIGQPMCQSFKKNPEATNHSPPLT